MAKTIVTPWEVKGNIDYNKLIEDFGVQKIDTSLMKRIEILCKKKNMQVHQFLRRGVFFAHRDLKMALDAYDDRKKLFLYTGCGPSGPIHMGHKMVWEFTKWLQDLFDVELWFQFTDDEKFMLKRERTLKEVHNYMHDNMLDIIALGFNPKKTHFLVDTLHANIMYPEAIKVAKRITFSTVKSVFGFTNETNVGISFFTSMQAVPAFLPSIIKKKTMACLIPHAIDQDPHFRISRDIIPKLGFPKPASIQCRFLPGLAGMQEDGKLSSSTGVAIYLTDDENTVKKKIMKYAFSGGQPSVEEHREKGGNPDIDVSFQWLTFFEEDDEKLKQIYDNYKSGKLLTGELKQILVNKLNEFLKEHQKKRIDAEKLINQFIYKE